MVLSILAPGQVPGPPIATAATTALVATGALTAATIVADARAAANHNAVINAANRNAAVTVALCRATISRPVRPLPSRRLPCPLTRR